MCAAEAIQVSWVRRPHGRAHAADDGSGAPGSHCVTERVRRRVGSWRRSSPTAPVTACSEYVSVQALAVICFASSCRFLKRSRDGRPEGSQPAFAWGLLHPLSLL